MLSHFSCVTRSKKRSDPICSVRSWWVARRTTVYRCASWRSFFFRAFSSDSISSWRRTWSATSSCVSSTLISGIDDSLMYTSMYAFEIFGNFHCGVCPGGVWCSWPPNCPSVASFSFAFVTRSSSKRNQSFEPKGRMKA